MLHAVLLAFCRHLRMIKATVSVIRGQRFEGRDDLQIQCLGA